MQTLIPPPIVAALTALLMWGFNRAVGWGQFSFALQHPIALTVAAAALALMLTAAVHMFAQRTTVNPLRPDRAKHLVTTGVFAYSRNPIYLADLLLLAAWALWLGNVFSIALLGAFVAYINRFQIAPEERALARLFGAEFDAYCARVRRWV